MHLGKYNAKRDAKGNLVVENVPIFVECERGENNFDKEWIAEAVLKAKQAETEGYLPPLHIRHHEAGTPVEPAGYFRIRGSGPITFKGDTRTAIFADLIVTRDYVAEDVIAARLPYRSVEIFDVDEPAINSLALLDHEPPYLELPMLMVDDPAPRRGDDGELAVPQGGSPVRVADATFRNPYAQKRDETPDGVVACFRRGRSAHLFLEDYEPMSKTKKPGPKKGAQFADRDDAEYMADDEDEEKMQDEADEADEKMSDDEGDDGKDFGGDVEDDAEGESEDGLDIAAVCKSIQAGTISVADMEEIKAAILAQMSAMAPAEQQPPQDPAVAAAPAPTPGAAMKKDDQFARLAGENAALKARLDARDAADEINRNVNEALRRLDGRPLGADPRGQLEAFHKEHGAKAFTAYVESIEKTFGRMSNSSTERAAAFAAQSTPAAEEALAYTEQGSEAVEQATQFAAQHKQLVERGYRRSATEFIASNMRRAGFKAAKPAK